MLAFSTKNDRCLSTLRTINAFFLELTPNDGWRRMLQDSLEALEWGGHCGFHGRGFGSGIHSQGPGWGLGRGQGPGAYRVKAEQEAESPNWATTSRTWRSMCCLSHNPKWGPGPQPKHEPWPGIATVTFWFAGQCPTHWATPVMGTT